MKRWLVVGLAVMAVLAVTPVLAQLAPLSAEGVAMGHIHLTVTDVEANNALFLAMGGTPVSKGRLQLIEFPGAFVMLRKGEPKGGSVGSTVNHFGFRVKNIKEAAAKWKAGGGAVEAGTSDSQNWFTTPDGIRVEINEDSNQAMASRVDHVHFFTADAQETENWYAKMFGAVPTGRNQPRFGEASIPGTLLRFNKNKEEAGETGTQGRALDHIGFEVKNVEEACKKLEAAGIKLNGPVRTVPNTNLKVAFFTDPWGTYVELTENLAP